MVEGEPRSGQATAAILRGAGVALLGSLFGGGFGFVFTIVMARLLPQADFGLLVLAAALLTGAATLGVAGVDYAMIRFVAAATTPGAKRGAMITPVALVTALNVVVAALTFAFARPIAVHLLGQPRFVEPLRAVAITLPLTVLAQMFSACLSALELAQGELARKVTEQGGRIVFAPIAIALGYGVTGAVGGMAVAAAVAAVVVATLLLRHLPRGGETTRTEAAHILTFAWPQAVAMIASQIWEVGNVVILAHTAGRTAVAVYGAALAVARLPALIYNSLAYRFSPAISRLWSAGERAEVAELLQTVTRWIVIFGIPLYAVAIVAPSGLLHIFGGDYAGGYVALTLIAVGSLFNSITGPVETALIMTGRVKLEMAANVSCALTLLAASLVLTTRFGLTGAAVATMGYSFTLNTVKAWLVSRFLGMLTFSRELLGPLAAGAVGMGVGLAIALTTTLDHSLAGTAVIGIAVLATYALFLLRVVGLRESDRRVLSLALRPTR